MLCVRWHLGCGAALHLGTMVTAIALTTAFIPGAMGDTRGHLVDWSDWRDPPNDGPNIVARETLAEPSASPGGGKGYLRRRVDECARGLELRGVTCDETEHEDHFRVPRMESGDLECGFQARLTRKTLEDLAAQYVFHFFGDSTMRRLSESFVAIATGNASYHPYYHEDRDLTSRSLQAFFHWAPYCNATLDEPDVAGAIEEVVSQHEEGNRGAARGGSKRLVIVTAFGIWEADHRGCTEAAFNACAEVAARLVDGELFSSIGVNMTADGDGGGALPPLPSPLMFLLQNNPFMPLSEQDAFLSDLHEVQRAAVLDGGGGDRQGGNAEVFLVHDRASLYESMPCYRIGEEVHYHEPVKLVEGKMLWDLVALVARSGDFPAEDPVRVQDP